MWWGPKPTASNADGGQRRVLGAVSGFTSTMSQAGGPPQVFVLPQRLPNPGGHHRSSPPSTPSGDRSLGQFSTHGLATSFVLLPIAVAANLLGIWLVRITPTEVFYKIAHWMVLFISCGLLWQGVSRAWAG
jgi:uncharacterized membrane protein YfcA